MNQQPSSWTSSVSRAAWTLLLAAFVVFVAWQLLKQLVVPLIVIVAVLGIIRFAVMGRRTRGW